MITQDEHTASHSPAGACVFPAGSDGVGGRVFSGRVIQVALGKRGVALIDEADWPLVCGRSWTLFRKNGMAYAVSYESKRVRRMVFMHRLLLGAEPGQFVDHVDSDGLNNTRANIRLCTRAENMRNTKTRCVSRTGARNVGIAADKRRKKFCADVKACGVRVRKRFESLEEAVKWADEQRKRLHGEFAYDASKDHRNSTHVRIVHHRESVGIRNREVVVSTA